MEQKQTNGMAVASLVLGIVSAVCIFFGYFAFIGIITGIVGLVLGVMAKKKQPCGMATAGIVLPLWLWACASSLSSLALPAPPVLWAAPVP